MKKAQNAAALGPAGPSPAADKGPPKTVCPQWLSKGECDAGTNCKLGKHPKKQKGAGKKD